MSARVMETVLEVVVGRVPIIVGASHPEAAQRVALSKAAAAVGALAVIIAPYAEVASAIDTPIVVQDFPPVNQITMTSHMLARMAEQIPTACTL